MKKLMYCQNVNVLNGKKKNSYHRLHSVLANRVLVMIWFSHNISNEPKYKSLQEIQEWVQSWCNNSQGSTLNISIHFCYKQHHVPYVRCIDCHPLTPFKFLLIILNNQNFQSHMHHQTHPFMENFLGHVLFTKYQVER